MSLSFLRGALTGRLRVLCVLLPALALGVLAGCSTSDDDSDAKVRLLNASPGYSSLDLYVDDEIKASTVAYGAVSDYAKVDSETLTTALRRAGSSTNLIAVDRSYGSDTNYTLVAYGWDGALKSVLMTDEEDTPDDGKVEVRVFNSATDAGSLAVYLSDSDTDIAEATPVTSSVTGGAFSSYVEFNQGTYRLRVTGADDTSDLRLDLSSLTLSNKSIVTIILTPSSGGTLVHAVVVSQGGSATAYSNTMARVRLVAGTADNANHSAVVGTTTLSTTMKSPSVGAYTQVTAGTGQTLAVAVNGTKLTTYTSVDLTAGSDVSLLVYGPSASPQLAVITDDNRLPTTSTYAKIRLVNGLANHDSTLSLNLNYAEVATDVALGAGSSFKSVSASTDSVMTVNSPLASSALYTWGSSTTLTISAKGVYTVFMLGDYATTDAAKGVLVKDR